MPSLITEKVEQVEMAKGLTEPLPSPLGSAPPSPPLFFLDLIGDGPLMGETRALANQLDVPVKFLGSRPHSEVQQQLHQSRVLCLPSVTAESGDAEGFGMVKLEAQACGVPLATSARGGAAEGIIDGKTGIAFAEGDEAAMTNGLIRLLQEDDFASTASTAAVAHAQVHFDIRKCAEGLEQIYANHTLV